MMSDDKLFKRALAQFGEEGLRALARILMRRNYHREPLRAGDKVRVVRQSTTINAHINMVGYCGTIEEVRGDWAQVNFPAQEGIPCSAAGGVPLDCLELRGVPHAG